MKSVSSIYAILPVAASLLLLQPGSASAQSRERGSNLGGGFIEFLFSGGRDGEAAAAPAPGRQAARPAAPVYVIDMGQGGDLGRGAIDPRARLGGRPRYAYAEPLSAGPSGLANPGAQSVRPRFDPQFERQLVDFDGRQAPGTIIIDTSRRYLYLVQPDGKALRYGVGVGRAGFEWHGTRAIARKAEWPDWRPPAEMLRRRPDLPTYMAGGPRNPLGARAMYLGGTLYRIHGSNEPHTIGQAVSSGCIRMRNEDVIDLYDRVRVGTKVVVL
jgi:lipoprotein-anchoring transpeptidase ErfK/SrfK